jgi:hypothetical protein
MGDYGASRYAQAAAKLSAGLAGQLHKQLGITPEQFLADGQAAADAGKVITALRADGVTVYGAKLNGTALTLTVRDAAGASAAEADGATAVIGTAQPVKTVKAKAVSSPADGTSPLLGGDLWAYYTDSSAGEGVICSTGFNGYDKITGAREFLTAGHCAAHQDTGDPAPEDGVVYAAFDDTPVNLNGDTQLADPALGSLDQSSFHFGGGQDSGVVDVTDTLAKPAPAVNTWGSKNTTADKNSTASLGVENSSAIPVLGAAVAVAGAPVCHSGERTGWQCGIVKSAWVTAEVEGEAQTQLVDSIETNVCLLPGDSGGSFVSGQYAVGLASATSFAAKSDDPGSGAAYNTCSAPGFSAAYPMAPVSKEESAALSAQDFELAVSVPTPVVSAVTVNGVTGAGTLKGVLPRPFATGTPVSLSLDGHPKVATKADSSGNWSFSLTGLAGGVHHYTVTAGSGHSTATVTKTLNVGHVTVSGTLRVGSTLTAGLTGGPAGTVAYQWYANGKAVSTGRTYLIPASILGQTLTATVTVTAGGTAVAVAGGKTAAIAKGAFVLKVKPKLSGTPQVGKKLAVTTGTWSPAPSIKIQWYANGKPVARATGTSLTLPAALKGTVISVTVTAGKLDYVPVTVKLAESAKVK